MFDLFALENLIKSETLVSADQKQYHKVEINESTGIFPYQVSVESGSGGRSHGKQSYSFEHLKDAEKRFESFLTSYYEEGFRKKSVA